MKEAALVIIKPDGISKGLVGNVFTKFNQPGLEMVAIRIAKATKELAEEHYKHIKGQPFFDGVVSYLLGQFHKEKKLLAIIYYGDNAIKRCRKIAGATNPEEADPQSIRGAYGRITTKGIYENVVHVSSDKGEAKREIQIWFEPNDITVKLYPIKTVRTNGANKKKVWK
jgi:nucleoside-diphosphate kinase